jgi:hypothetical protein
MGRCRVTSELEGRVERLERTLEAVRERLAFACERITMLAESQQEVVIVVHELSDVLGRLTESPVEVVIMPTFPTRKEELN